MVSFSIRRGKIKRVLVVVVLFGLGVLVFKEWRDFSLNDFFFFFFFFFVIVRVKMVL